MNSGSPIDFSSLDSAVHGPVRLGILTALQADGALDFTTLKHRLSVVDGAIGTHLQKLEKIEYISCSKEFIGRRPRSTYEITKKGSEALLNYLEMMQRVLDSVKTKKKTNRKMV